MGKTTLIVGKEAPAGNVFAEVAMKHQRSVVLSVGQEEKESDESDYQISSDEINRLKQIAKQWEN